MNLQTVRDYLRECNDLDLKVRFIFLYPDESPYKDRTANIINGSLSINNENGLRRSLSINVENTGFDFLFDPQKFWVEQRFKLELGYEINGTDYYFPQGVFIISNIQLNDQGSDNSVSITAKDKFALLNGELGTGRLKTTYGVDVGTPIATVIKDILIEIGDTKKPILNIPNNDLTPYTLYIQSGGTYADMLLPLNGMLSSNMYYDVNGILRCEPEIPDIYKECVWDYYSDEFQYQGAVHNYPLNEVYNAIKVVGNNVNGDLATGYAENRNPQSYFSVYRTNNIPRLAPQIDDSVIPDDIYAQARAEYELKKIMAHFSSISLSSTPLFLLQENKIITLTADKLNLAKERFLINSLSIPLDGKGGLINIEGCKASDLAFL